GAVSGSGEGDGRILRLVGTDTRSYVGAPLLPGFGRSGNRGLKRKHPSSSESTNHLTAQSRPHQTHNVRNCSSSSPQVSPLILSPPDSDACISISLQSSECSKH